MSSLLPFVIGNHITLLSGELETLSNDLWGKVSRLLRRWEIPILGVHFFSSRLCFLSILLISNFLTFFLICFATVERLEFKEQYQGHVEAALEFALTLSFEDFKGLVGAHWLYECCLGLEPSELVLDKIALEERSILFLFFNDK